MHVCTYWSLLYFLYRAMSSSTKPYKPSSSIDPLSLSLNLNHTLPDENMVPESPGIFLQAICSDSLFCSLYQDYDNGIKVTIKSSLLFVICKHLIWFWFQFPQKWMGTLWLTLFTRPSPDCTSPWWAPPQSSPWPRRLRYITPGSPPSTRSGGGGWVPVSLEYPPKT